MPMCYEVQGLYHMCYEVQGLCLCAMRDMCYEVQPGIMITV